MSPRGLASGALVALVALATGFVVADQIRAQLLTPSNQVARYQAPSFDAVQFLTYRDDLNGNIGCGARTPPDRVYVTWIAGDLDGTVVALEFLPKK